MPILRSLAWATILVGWVGVARGEDGNPGVIKPFDGEDTVPINALIPVLGANGVPFGLAQLKTLEPRLVNGSSSVPLHVVDSFDDLEGHATPFPEGGGGYGENLILLASRTRLAANTRYAFTVGKGNEATAYFGVSTGGEADTKAPDWRHAPFLDLNPPQADGPQLPSHIITALAESSELPLYFIVELKPQEPGARPKRMIAALHLPSSVDSNCGFVNVWDHKDGVHADDTDSDFGRRYIATLTAVDSAGNRSRAPGSGVPVVWSGGIAVCNKPDVTPAAGQGPLPPRSLEKPTHNSTIDRDFRSSDDRGTTYKHSLMLSVETTTVAAIELNIRRSKAPFTAYRRVGLLWPTKQVPLSPNPQARGEEGCVEPLIINADREKPMPANDEPVSVQVAIVDSLGRRLVYPGPPIVVSNLHPYRSRITVCATATLQR